MKNTIVPESICLKPNNQSFKKKPKYFYLKNIFLPGISFECTHAVPNIYKSQKKDPSPGNLHAYPHQEGK